MSIFKRIRDERGFTLVELLVTVTIIGVLAAVVTVGVSGSSSTAQTKANQGTFADVQSGIDSWLASNPTMAVANIPVSVDVSTATQSWYSANGIATSGTLGAANTYWQIDFTSSAGSPTFTSFFRRNAGTSVVCALPVVAVAGPSYVASSSTVFSCHN